MNDLTVSKSWRSRLASRSMLGLVGLLLAVLAALWVQHLRHGWPFSLHHVPLPAHSAGAAAPAPAAPVERVPVAIEAWRLSALGITLATVSTEAMAAPVRAVATVVPDESRLSHIHARVAGWLEQVEIPPAGTAVTAGQPVAAIFSQELYASQSEYLAALGSQGAGARSPMVEAGRQRLRVLGMTDGQIAAIERDRKPRRLVTLFAPRSGTVLRRGVSVGTAVDPSTELLSIADLSRVWIVAEVPESQTAGMRAGIAAVIEVPGSGRAPFSAVVDFVYPTLSERTRTLRVRFTVDNPDGRLRPGLYGSAEFRAEPRTVLTVPRDAVVDTGASQHVFVAGDDGSFVPRRVRLGTRLSDRVEVVEGLGPAEAVVASGVFLIDSESRLRASGGAGSGHGAHGGASPQPEPEQDDSHSGHAQ